MAPAQGAAVFLDRDGTLIREVNYLCRPEQVEILPGCCRCAAQFA
jgi:histidinol phosphatase-like enzyme